MRITVTVVVGSLLFSAAVIAGCSDSPTSSPPPSTERFAEAAIANAGHPCGGIVSARELTSTDIRATCSNGESYRIIWLNGKFVTMRCSVARAIGVDGC